MSARQPFLFSSSRPPSRADQPVDATTAVGQQEQSDPQPQPSSNAVESSHLNLSSFKNRSPGSKNQKQSRGSFGNLIRAGMGQIARSTRRASPTLAGDTQIRGQRDSKIAAPHPSTASAFFSLSTGPFKVPEIPYNKTVTPRPGLTHTSIEGSNTELSGPDSQTAAITLDLSGNPMIQPVCIRSMTHAQALEKIVEIDPEERASLEIEELPSKCIETIEYPFGEDGPRRLSSTIGPPAQIMTNGRTLRRSKRSLTLSEEALQDFDTEEYGNVVKRSKLDDMAMQNYDQALLTHQTPQRQDHVRSPADAHRSRATRRSSRSSRNRNGPRSIFACDLESYIAAHEEEYHALVQKWSQCSLEQWQAGEKEIVDQFCSVMDFVKDHMATKLKRFAQIDTRIAEHKNVLAQREKLLAEVKDGLIKDGGAVIGGHEEEIESLV